MTVHILSEAEVTGFLGPGIGVDVDIKKLTPIADYTEHYAPIQLNHRPDGSYTNW